MCIIDFFDKHTWVANLIGIIVSASVAIWVMDRNQKHSISLENAKTEKERNKIKYENSNKDKITQQRAERILNSLSVYSHGYALGISSYNDIQKIGKQHIISELIEMIAICKEVRKFDYFTFGERQIETIKLCDEILREAKNIQMNLIAPDQLPSAATISQKFRKIYNLLYDYYENSEHVSLEDGKLPSLF